MYIYFLYALIICILVIFIYLLIRKKTQQVSFLGLISFNIFILLWIVLVWLILVFNDRDFVVWFVRLTYVATSLSVASFVVFIRYNINKKYDITTILVLILSFISAFISMTDRVIPEVVLDTNEKYVPVIFGPLATFFALNSIFGILVILFSVYQYRKKSEGVEALRLTYMTLGMAIGGFSALMTNVIIPSITGKSDTALLGPIALSTISIITTYSYLKDRLFGIRFILSQALYFIVIAIFPTIFFILLVAILKIPLTIDLLIKSLPFIFFFSLLFAIFFTKLTSYLENNLLPVSIFKRFNPKDIKDAYTKTVSTELDITKLGTKTVDTFKSIHQTEKLGIIIFEKETKRIIYKNFTKLQENNLLLEELLSVINYWEYIGHSSVIVRSEIKETKIENNDLLRIEAFLEKNDLEVILPLNKEVQLNGIIILGSKKTKAPYTVEEITFFENLILNVSMAFGRAILYKEVNDFNQTLQLKVNEQTKELQTKVLELEEARRKETDMIDIMGHELRTPATIVKLNADLLHKFIDKIPEDKESFAKYVSRIKDAVENEIRLINTLLTSAKLEGNKIEINSEKIDLFKEIDMAVHGEEFNASSKGIQLINNVSSNISSVYADRARIVEVLNNLISNAVKYTQKGGVTINGIDEGEFVKISISDTGSGMSKEDLEKIGTKFYRAKTYIQSDQSDDFDIVRPGGTGLGLYVTFNLIRKMGGNIKVQSELGKGSTFTFTLPKYMNQSKTITEPNTNDMFVRIGLK